MAASGSAAVNEAFRLRHYEINPRQAMMALDLEAERLAALGIGVPFF